MYRLLTGQSPFRGMNDAMTQFNIVSVPLDLNKKVSRHLSK